MPDRPQEPRAFGRLAQELIGDLRGVPYTAPRRQVLRATHPAAEIVEQLMVKYQIGRPSPEQAVRDQWQLVVGPANAAYSHPLSIDTRGRLVVLTSHPVVRNEIFLHRQTVLERIRAIPGCDHIKEINLRAG